MQVDPVEQWSRHPGLIIGGAARRAAAGERGVAKMAAAARVHRGDQLDSRGEGDVRIGTRDADLAGFERLAQAVEHRSLEFGQLVEEQHAEMRQADLAGFHLEPAADERGHRGRMVRIAERARADEAAALERSGDAGDHRHFERFGRRKVGQDAGQAAGEQRFARTGRTDHQQIMPARRSDFERAFGALLPLDHFQIGGARRLSDLARLRRRKQGRSLEMVEQGEQIGRGDHLYAARPCRLRPLRGGTDEPLARAACV